SDRKGSAVILSHGSRIRDARLEEPLGAQRAAVTVAARTASRPRIVTAGGQTVIEPERHTSPDDVGFSEGDERRMDAKGRAFDAGASGHGREPLEGRNEFRPAVRVPRIIERVHTDDDIAGAEDLGPTERKREEDGVPRRHVRRWNLGSREIAIARNRLVSSQRGAADATQVDRELEMPFDTERSRDGPGRRDLVAVTL